MANPGGTGNAARGVDAFDIYRSVTFEGKHRNLPAYVEGVVLQLFLIPAGPFRSGTTICEKKPAFQNTGQLAFVQ